MTKQTINLIWMITTLLVISLMILNWKGLT